MNICARKTIIAACVAGVLLVANLSALVAWLEGTGVIGLMRDFRAEYLTGTAVCVIAVILTLTPSSTKRSTSARTPGLRCPVCNEELKPRGRYCAACGSLVAR